MRLADVQFTPRGAAVVAQVTGEIDLSNAQDLEGALTEAVPNHSLGLIVDMSGLKHLDSAGIQLIYRLREALRARGQILHVVIPETSPANDALRLAGVERHIETLPTVDAALEQLPLS